MSLTAILVIVAIGIVWILLGVLYQLWEARCPVCGSWATQKLDKTRTTRSNFSNSYAHLPTIDTHHVEFSCA